MLLNTDIFAYCESIYTIAKVFKMMREVNNIFSNKASRVIRVLLVNVGKRWTIEELSNEANVSLGYTHAVVTTLLKQDNLHRDRTYKVKLSNPGLILRRWASYSQYTAANTFLRYHTFTDNIDSFLRSFKEIENGRYAFTVLTGAHIVAPYVRPTNIHFYIENERDIEYYVGELGLRPVETGGNVSMVIPYDEGVFYGIQDVDGLNVVSNVQLYVDLMNYPARGGEAADRIKSLLEKEWEKILFQ